MIKTRSTQKPGMNPGDKLFGILICLTIIDLLVFGAAVIPGFLGYVGSDSWAWNSLFVGVISGAFAFISVPFLALVVLLRKQFKKK